MMDSQNKTGDIGIMVIGFLRVLRSDYKKTEKHTVPSQNESKSGEGIPTADKALCSSEPNASHFVWRMRSVTPRIAMLLAASVSVSNVEQEESGCHFRRQLTVLHTSAVAFQQANAAISLEHNRIARCLPYSLRNFPGAHELHFNLHNLYAYAGTIHL